MHLKSIINILLYQLAWFACVLGAAKHAPWIGVAVTLLAITWHFLIAKQLKQEIFLVLSITALGSLFDQLLLMSSIVQYEAHGWSNSLVPVWIVAMWLSFATTLNISLRWMRMHQPAAAVLFGAIGGPIAYLAAEILGAVTLHRPLCFWVLAIGWAGIMPVLVALATRFDGFLAANHVEAKA